MISLQQFQSVSTKEQKQYLISLIGDIETETNQELLVCQRLLQVIDQPSAKTLQYIFEIITGQLQGFHEQERATHTHNVSTLLEHIRQQEEADKTDVDALLSDIELDIS
ncbi:MAG: hypothetical protein LBG52_05395 [Candidatus Peribacteria bacterium]|jgi:hypothetical protein|nr:hypothetical protein [Candidatus Peribacteria bacterium]